MSEFADNIRHNAELIRFELSGAIDCAVILGSGLNEVASDLIQPETLIAEFNYANIKCLPVPSIVSHAGKLSIVKIGRKTVAFCQGRSHLYEGHTAQEVSAIVYLLKELGNKRLIVSNAAGALNAEYQPGEVMLITDHINFTAQNPIVGQGNEFGSIFADMSQAYDKALRDACLTAHSNCRQGIYAGVLGPSMETSAERRMMRTLGADAVGMSTVMEVIAANHCGMNVLGVSAITNSATGDENQRADSIEEVLKNAAIAAKEIKNIVRTAIAHE